MREQRLRFADTSPSTSCAYKEGTVSICKRRGGNDNKDLSHNELLLSVQSDPDAISMSFIHITSLLNGVSGSGFLSHAINLYLPCKKDIILLLMDKPPTDQFLTFQLLLQWAPVFSDLPLGPQRRHLSTASLQFSFWGPKLLVNTSPVDVGKRPVTGLQLYLESKKSNRLAIHMQHLSSLPKLLELTDDPNDNFRWESYDCRYYEKGQWKNFSTSVQCQSTPPGPVQAPKLLKFVDTAEMRRGPHDIPGSWIVCGARLCG